jgi:hypothetical protein
MNATRNGTPPSPVARLADAEASHRLHIEAVTRRVDELYRPGGHAAAANAALAGSLRELRERVRAARAVTHDLVAEALGVILGVESEIADDLDAGYREPHPAGPEFGPLPNDMRAFASRPRNEEDMRPRVEAAADRLRGVYLGGVADAGDLPFDPDPPQPVPVPDPVPDPLEPPDPGPPNTPPDAPLSGGEVGDDDGEADGPALNLPGEAITDADMITVRHVEALLTPPRYAAGSGEIDPAAQRVAPPPPPKKRPPPGKAAKKRPRPKRPADGG